MIVDSFPPVPTSSIELISAAPRFRRRPLPPLKERLEFGGPMFTAITSEYHKEDDDLQAFIRGKAGVYRYVLAHLSVNFPVKDGPELTSAKVQVNLSDDGSPPGTIAYSLLPTRAGSPYEETRGYSVSPDLKLGPVAVAGSVGGQTVDHGQRNFVLGGPELAPTSAWTFQRTRTQKLVGSTRLAMIVQVPTGHIGTMSVDLHAEVEKGVFRKRRVPLHGGSGTDQGESSF